MNENLIKRKDLRQTTIENNKKEKDFIKIDSEDSDYILKQINDMKIIIETKLEDIDKKSDKIEIEIHLKDLETHYQRLNKLINDSSLFLAKYNLKSSQTLLNSIRSKIDDKKDSLIPKSKFSFKTSFKANPKSIAKPVDCDQTDSSSSGLELTPFLGFKNLVNCEKPLQMWSEESNGRDIQLDGLENCCIEIFGAPNALKVNNLKNCNIFCGPTTTSVLVTNCEKCLFRIASQQIRIHSSFETDFYIHVKSRSIIEDSNKIRFAPYDWTYDNITKDFKSADLDVNTNNWKQIDDFDCLATDQSSKNWSFIE